MRQNWRTETGRDRTLIATHRSEKERESEREKRVIKRTEIRREREMTETSYRITYTNLMIMFLCVNWL